ncbi:MAG: 5-formyltetrahydrofolate cyclo-ligase [Phycisphaerae bacterium]
MTKTEYRKFMKSILRAIPPVQLTAKSQAACKRMIQTAEFQAARNVMLYLPMPGELDVGPLTQAVLQSAKQLLLPMVDWNRRQMTPMAVNSFESYGDPQWAGMRQPLGGEPFDIRQIDLVVTPGLAFGFAGERLGRGKGFYDRFLSQRDLSALRTAVAFHEQCTAEIPTEPHDVSLQMIVTDQEVLRVNPLR